MPYEELWLNRKRWKASRNFLNNTAQMSPLKGRRRIVGNIHLIQETRGIKSRKWADDISAIYERTGKPVTLVGWSHGGMTSILAANEVPDKVGRIITLAGVVNPAHPSVEPKNKLSEL